jgi:hypothetical protein
LLGKISGGLLCHLTYNIPAGGHPGEPHLYNDPPGDPKN